MDTCVRVRSLQARPLLDHVDLIKRAWGWDENYNMREPAIFPPAFILLISPRVPRNLC